MESKRSVYVIIKTADNGCSENLFRDHAIRTSIISWVLVADLILKNIIADGRIGINDVPDGFSILFLGVLISS